MAAEFNTIPPSLERFLDVDRLREWARGANPELRQRFDTYVSEAVFFRSVLDADIIQLKPGSSIVEIGSGIGLLSRLLAAEGHRVVAFEPESAGFGVMGALSRVLDHSWLLPPGDVTQHHEPFSAAAANGDEFDLAIAINVIEHVPDPARLVIDATSVLASAGRARFVCPNYAFPYEPHFGFPTLWSKSLTCRLARRAIANSSVAQPEAFWDDLSWPTQRKLGRALAAADVTHEFSRSTLQAYTERLSDPSFTDRKGSFFQLLAGALRRPVEMGVRVFPLSWAPIIDLTTMSGRRRSTAEPAKS